MTAVKLVIEFGVPVWLTTAARIEFRGTVADLDIASEDEPGHPASIMELETDNEPFGTIVPHVNFNLLSPDLAIGQPVLGSAHRVESRRAGQPAPITYVVARTLELPAPW